MRINVFGLGYVGGVNAICMAAAGHEVRGFDIIPSKIEAFASGKLPMYEAGLSEIQSSIGKTGGSLRFAADANGTLCQAEVSVVCVGTPALETGDVDLAQLDGTLRQIGAALANSTSRHTVILRSTVPPGTCDSYVVPLLEELSNKKCGKDIGFCFYPEFLREGSAVEDYYKPSVNIVGASDELAYQDACRLFSGNVAVKNVALRTAEMIKYTNNTFHALKVSFANEIGSLCKAQQVDVAEVMKVFLSDRQLNISERYLHPGAAFGGPCLPKEVRAIVRQFERSGLRAPVISAILPSNDAHIRRMLAVVEASRAKKVGVLGLSFKPDTDDLRGSPVLQIINRLVNEPSYKTRRVCAYDRPEALAKAHEIYGDRISYAASQSELVDSSEMLILGAYPPNDEVLRGISAFKGMIIDMKFHEAPASIVKHSNYVTIC